MRQLTLSSVFCIIVCSLPICAQENTSLDDQLRAYLQKDYFTLNVLLQSEVRYSFRDDDFQGGRTFNVANARISLGGKLHGGFFYRVLINASPEPALLDAFVGYRLDDAFSLSIGAMKPRQTLDYIPDPGSHNFVDRTTMTDLLVGSREIGLSATGDLGGFYYYAGIFNGNRLNSNKNNKFYGIGRVQYTVKELFPGYIQIAISGSRGNTGGTVSGSSGPLLRGQREIVGSDIELKWKRLYLAAEYLQGKLETVDLPNTNELISGYYLTGGLRLSNKVMTFGRWQSWTYKELGSTENKLTLGTNISFTEIVGLVVNLDAYMSDLGDTQYGASCIFQIQF